MVTKRDAPRLEGWITLAELAARLHITRQGVHDLAARGRISTLHRLGAIRPVWVMREAEVESLRRSSPVSGESDSLEGASHEQPAGCAGAARPGS